MLLREVVGGVPILRRRFVDFLFNNVIGSRFRRIILQIKSNAGKHELISC